MKHIALALFLLFLTFTHTIAEDKEKNNNGESQTNVPKRSPPTPASAPEANKGEPFFKIGDVCKDTRSSTYCATTLKELGADKNDVKPNKFAATLIREAQSEFGHTSTKAREKMREDDLDRKIKQALSNCVKLYLDIADELRGLFLAVKSRKLENASKDFSQMGEKFPQLCEDGLTRAGTNGTNLKLYNHHTDLENLASTVDAVVRYIAAARKAAGKE